MATEIFVFRPSTLLYALEEAAKEGAGDLGKRVLPSIVDASQVRCVPMKGSWRDVGTVSSYHSAHMEMLERRLDLDLGDPTWPILGRTWPFPPARIDGGAVSCSMLSPGATVQGTVTRSVIGPGTVIERGSEVADSVILDQVVIRERSSVTRAILDTGVELGVGAVVKGDSEESTDGITVMSR